MVRNGLGALDSTAWYQFFKQHCLESVSVSVLASISVSIKVSVSVSSYLALFAPLSNLMQNDVYNIGFQSLLQLFESRYHNSCKPQTVCYT